MKIAELRRAEKLVTPHVTHIDRGQYQPPWRKRKTWVLVVKWNDGRDEALTTLDGVRFRVKLREMLDRD